MTLATGTHHPISDLSSRELVKLPRTRAYAEGKQLLTGEPRPLPFAITFRTGERVEVTLMANGSEPSSHWRVFGALQRLAGLEANWDSYGAMPLNPLAVRRGVGLLASIVPGNAPEPTVVPTRDGGIQFEWHYRRAEVEVTIPPTGNVSFIVSTSNSESEGVGLPDRLLILTAFAEMARED